MPSPRLFLALWPDDATRDSLAAAQQAWTWPAGAALVPREKLHITLHFLGQVPAARLAALQPVVDIGGEPFMLAGDGARQQVWPGGIAVLELAAPPALQRLHAALATALRAQDFPVEDRPFRAHVTFARKAWGAQPPVTPLALAWRCEGTWSLVHSIPLKGYRLVELDGLR